MDDIKAIVLGNLCTSYVCVGENEKAEQLIQQVTNPLQKCVINLVIGTLYCTKGHDEFGIQRLMESVNPIEEKINIETWFYIRRCILHYVYKVASLQIVPNYDLNQDLLGFLNEIDEKSSITLIKTQSRQIAYALLKVND